MVKKDKDRLNPKIIADFPFPTCYLENRAPIYSEWISYKAKTFSKEKYKEKHKVMREDKNKDTRRI